MTPSPCLEIRGPHTPHPKVGAGRSSKRTRGTQISRHEVSTPALPRGLAQLSRARARWAATPTACHRLILRADGQPVVDQRGLLEALRVLFMIDERRAKLLGVDARSRPGTAQGMRRERRVPHVRPVADTACTAASCARARTSSACRQAARSARGRPRHRWGGESLVSGPARCRWRLPGGWFDARPRRVAASGRRRRP